MTSLRGLSVLVSGATGGIGAPISRRLALEGAQLTLLGRDIKRLEALDLDASLEAGDLREPETAVRAAAAAVAAHGRLDGLVVASGVVAFGPVGDLPDQALVDLFLVNTLAPVRLLRAVLPPPGRVGPGQSITLRRPPQRDRRRAPHRRYGRLLCVEGGADRLRRRRWP